MLKLVIVVAFVLAPTPTTGGECKQSCAKAYAPWSQKCNWLGCRSCTDCFPSVGTCTPCDDDPGVLNEYLLLNNLTCATHHFGPTDRCNTSPWWRDEKKKCASEGRRFVCHTIVVRDKEVRVREGICTPSLIPCRHSMDHRNAVI